VTNFPFPAVINGRAALVERGSSGTVAEISYSCNTCGGDGWYVDHSDDCYASGECVGCGGVQRPCPDCVVA
jgi:hypothetical protein